MPYRRRRSMGRRSSPRSVVQSFKKVLNYAGSSHSAGDRVNFTISIGTDSLAAGQTSVTDTAVPTGSVITSITVQYAITNLVNVTNFLHTSMQRVLPGQITIAPNIIGGSNQRNQVHLQQMKSVGQSQNMYLSFTFKVPKGMQRVKEGAQWVFCVLNTAVSTDACQIIYKFYR